MSGVESAQHYQACLDAKVQNVLLSFLYLQKKDPDLIRDRKKKNPEVNFFIDSGAFSFRKDFDKFKHWSMQDFEDYVAALAAFIKRNKDYLWCSVELDIQFVLSILFGGNAASTVGPSIVKKWQDQYFLPLQEKGVDIIFVWHEELKMDGWEEMCGRFPYVGLPGYLSSEPDFNKYMSIARRYMTKVHGFAATKQADFRDWPWTSIDSITWKTSEMFGTLIHWDDRKQLLTFEADKANRPLYRADIEARGLNAQAIIDDTDYKEVTKYSLGSMRLMEAFYERKYASRVFYYERRLPDPHAVLHALTDAQVSTTWHKLQPPDYFKSHAGENKIPKMREYLAALSCVQYRQQDLLATLPESLRFLENYFPKLVTPKLVESEIFAKELAAYLSPGNPPPLSRSEPAHYVAGGNSPKTRVRAREFSLDDLEDKITDFPFTSEQL